MNAIYFGVDTSNYRTSAAVFDALCGEWTNEGQLLTVPDGSLGLRQSDALFQHTIHLHKMIALLPCLIERKLCAVGVSTRPRAVEGSYMPCFLAGENVARSVAHLLGAPLFICSHQQGHLAAAALSAGALSLLDAPFYAWHLSGGTTELLLVHPTAQGLPHAQCIGGTTDLSAGQLIDRAGQMLALPFPSGEALDQLACTATESTKSFQPIVNDGLFSLSGVQNKIKDLVAQCVPPSTVAQFTIQTIGNAVIKATEQALKKKPLPILCAGGVMSSVLLRGMLEHRFLTYFAEPRLSGDNAVGVAVLAALQNGESLCQTKFTPSHN